MNQINENNLTSFFGSVPVPMEVSFVGVCLGAPIQYRKDKNTGLDEICMMVPQKNGTVQPVMLTLGNADSIANGNRSAVYHACGIDKLLSEATNSAGCEMLSERFAAVANMGPTNDYIKKFFEPKIAELREKLIRYYPESIKDYDAAVTTYKSSFAKAFNTAPVVQVDNKEDDKKKQQMM